MGSMKSFTFILRYQCFDTALGNHPDMPGMLSLEYIRQAGSARQAIFGALSELRQINPQGYLAGVAPDLIDFQGVARLFGVNARNMRALMEKYGVLFPAPQFVAENPMWHSADILGLIAAQGLREIPEAELEMAHTVRAINRSLLQRAD